MFWHRARAERRPFPCPPPTGRHWGAASDCRLGFAIRDRTARPEGQTCTDGVCAHASQPAARPRARVPLSVLAESGRKASGAFHGCLTAQRWARLGPGLCPWRYSRDSVPLGGRRGIALANRVFSGRWRKRKRDAQGGGGVARARCPLPPEDRADQRGGGRPQAAQRPLLTASEAQAVAPAARPAAARSRTPRGHQCARACGSPVSRRWALLWRPEHRTCSAPALRADI